MTNRQAKTPNSHILTTSLAAILVALVLVASSSVALGHARHHVVRPGDTLSSIAQAYGTSVAELLELNDIANQDLILAGASLQVSPGHSHAATAEAETSQPTGAGSKTAAPKTVPPDTGDPATSSSATDSSKPVVPEAAGSRADTGNWRKYVIQPGDWLATIATRHRLTVAELAAANKISNPNLIFVGQVILVPSAAAEQKASSAADPPADQPDSAIPPSKLPASAAADPAASKTALTPLETAESNPAAPIIPEPGIDLSSVPATGSDSPVPPPDESRSTTATASTAGRVVELRHKIKPGDTLAKLAVAYGLPDHQSLLAANPGLTPETLTAGSFVTIAGVTVADRLEYWGRHYGVPVELFKALTWWESGWNNTLVSWAGAIGIGQLIPATVDFVSKVLIGIKLDPNNPDDNIRMSARFLRYLLDETGNDRALTLGAYYQGLYAVRTKGIYNSSMPYVTGILSLQSKFK